MGRVHREGGALKNVTRWVGAMWVVAVVLPVALAMADETGVVVGGVSGVAVTIAGLELRPAITDASGRFTLDGVPVGTHTLELSMLDFTATEEGVVVEAGRRTEVRREVDWDYVLAESLTVVSVSRRAERIVEAPAAVSSITPEHIAREAGSGQLAKILESSTGAEITQSGLFDFKINVRGVNGSVNRRVAVLIDGRNPSFPMSGAQEWSAVSFPVDDLAAAELIRGPSSALYGANAFNGILNLTTKSARDRRGGFVRLGIGDLSTGRADLSVSGPIGAGWHGKLVGGYHDSEDFAVSRNQTVEYSQPCTGGQTVDCLALEPIPLPLDTVKLAFGGVRLDRDLPGARTLALEGGTASIEGTVFTTSLGRFQLLDVQRPWARFNLNSPKWNLLGYYTGRDAEAASLFSGLPSYAEGLRAALEWQTSHEFAAGRGRFVGGVFLSVEEIDSTDPNGFETLLTEPKDADISAVFGQVDYDLTEKTKLVLAARFDDNSLHDSQISPKASLVYAATPTQVLRFSYNEGFLSPNYPEFFLQAPLAPPFDLSFLEPICAPASCGFDRPVPFLAVGNDDLTVEKIRSFEIGYHGVLGRKAFVSADLYWSEMKDFVQVLIPQVGTEAGRANPDFGPYRPPAGLPTATAAVLEGTLAAVLGPFFPVLSNFPDGSPVIIFLSNVNFGEVETMGLELSLDYAIGRNWNLDANYSWLDFDAKSQLIANPLAANAPDNKANLGVTYVGGRFTGSAYLRWFDSFRWEEGTLDGPVPSYSVLNVVGLYDASDNWQVGVNVSNLLDDEHYEFFGGDLMELRAIAHVTYRWP